MSLKRVRWLALIIARVGLGFTLIGCRLYAANEPTVAVPTPLASIATEMPTQFAPIATDIATPLASIATEIPTQVAPFATDIATRISFSNFDKACSFQKYPSANSAVTRLLVTTLGL